jgi:hypothetical protein
MKKDSIDKTDLIAPCGMNCAICGSYLSLINDIKNKGIRIPYCSGCIPRNKKCAFLKKRCELLINGNIRFCYECEKFPCDNLERIDKRYQLLYRMSMIENLKFIKENGIEKFIVKENQKWKCPECGGTISCHNGICFECGLDKLKNKKKMYRWEDE